MLRKLMKYDLRAMGRVLLPVWGCNFCPHGSLPC